MPIPRPAWRRACALLASGTALVSACLLSAGLKRIEARSSHQQPTPEAWLVYHEPASPAALTDGRKLFLGSCAHCHGADATGDEGPDLHAVQVSDRYIAHVISHGIKGEMPSFAKKLKGSDVAELTAYLRSLD